MRALEQNEGFEAALRALPMSCEWLVPGFSVICNERVMREGRDPLEIVPKTEEEKQQIFPGRAILVSLLVRLCDRDDSDRHR